MQVNRIILATLVGIGFTSLLALMLNVPLQPVPYLAFLLLAPGGIVTSVLFKLSWLGPPVPVLVSNAAVYSAIAYLVFYCLTSRLSTTRTLVVAAVALPLAFLASVPNLNPLWPRGMSELEETERTLRQGLPADSDLTSARAFLRGRGIDSYEYSATSEEVVLQRANVRIIAQPGDHVLSARVPTAAEQFPCSYRIDVVLVFDRQEKLQESNISRFPLCP